jgi:SPP1 gp7 family putative phage head morphogenesis protein
MQPGGDDDLREIAVANLDAWKQSGVVKTLKYYSAEDAEVCSQCRQHHGMIVRTDEAVIGSNLPPIDGCLNWRCRCYFRPWDVSLQ